MGRSGGPEITKKPFQWGGGGRGGSNWKPKGARRYSQCPGMGEGVRATEENRSSMEKEGEKSGKLGTNEKPQLPGRAEGLIFKRGREVRWEN